MAGIYIHIPYCRKLCSYCDFYKTLRKEGNPEYLNAVLREAELRRDYLAGEKISTIYFGGGTPSVFEAGDLKQFAGSLFGLFEIDSDPEITVEINPDDTDRKYYDTLLKAGFNRISIGVQSWRDSDLEFLNRRHNARQADKSIRDASAAGFTNIAVDLIYGLPVLSSEAWSDNLEKTFAFDIRHISAYHLTIEPGTLLGKMKQQGMIAEADEEESTNQFNILVEKTESAGFIHYEISNFAKEGYLSVHNSNYWKQVSYLGLGPSAHSFNSYSRQWNISDLPKYLNALKNNRLLFEREELDNRKRFNEYIMTSLRTMWGIDLEYVERNFEKEGFDYIVNLSGKFIEYGMMKKEGTSLVLTNQGKMISDNIISEFMMAGR